MHTTEELAAFQDGETRLITAAWADDRSKPLFVLGPDEAREQRQLTKKHLRCFIADCPAPRLTTVHRRRGRDGFRHLTRGAGGHAPESFHHIQGKAVVAHWLRTTYPQATVKVEHGIDTQRSRVADVMIEAGGNRRAAIEVQYAPITPDEFLARHQAYAEAGIVDIWLFGHTGHQFRRLRKESWETWVRVKLSPTHELVRELGMPLLWLNPGLQKVGFATSLKTVGRRSFPVFADKADGVLELEMLDQIRLTEQSVTSPQIERLLAGAVGFGKARAEQDVEDRAEREALARAAAERALTAEARERASQEAREAAWAEQRARVKREPKPLVDRAAGVGCRYCGGNLDPVLVERGFHILCGPGQLRRGWARKDDR